MGHRILAIHLFLHHTILIDAHSGQNVKDSLVHGLETINNERDSDLLPARVALLGVPPPVLRRLGLADVADIKPVKNPLARVAEWLREKHRHDTVQSPRIKRLVLVIRGDSDEKFGLTIVQFRPK